MKDLQDRCEKVIELEIQLDSLQAKQLKGYNKQMKISCNKRLKLWKAI